MIYRHLRRQIDGHPGQALAKELEEKITTHPILKTPQTYCCDKAALEDLSDHPILAAWNRLRRFPILYQGEKKISDHTELVGGFALLDSLPHQSPSTA